MSVAFVGVIMIGGAPACTSETRRDINEAVARNSIAVAGEKEFGDGGDPLEGTLDCRTKSTSTTEVTVECTGTTKNGEPVTLLGSTSDARQLRGSFVGTVGGTQAFKTSCLGC